MILFRPLFQKPEARAGRGVGLIEAVIGVAVFSLIAFSLYQTFITLFQAVTTNRLKISASALATEQIEIIRNLPYASVGIVSGLPAGVLDHDQVIRRDGIDFTVTTTVRNVDDPFDGTIGGPTNDSSPADYKLVDIEIACDTCKNFPPLAFTTTSSPKSLETASNNGALFVQVFDANGVPVQDADVHIVSSLTPPLTIDDVTNSAGLLQLVDVPPGNNAYKITVSKAGYSTEQTYPATVLGLSLQTSPSAQDWNAIHAVTSSDVWAVGDTGVIAHYNGTAWSAVTSPTAANLVGVSCLTTSDCTAITTAGQFIHWNGTAWSIAGTSLGQTMHGLYVASATSSWAVSGTGSSHGYIYRWNPSTSTVTGGTFNKDIGNNRTVQSVSCLTPSNCWAGANNGDIYQWLGTSWNFKQTANGQTWNGIAIVSANDAWIVGTGTSSGGTTSNVYHWNGTAWSPFTSGTSNTLYGVSCTSSISCTAVGASGKIISWNGTAWSNVSSPTGSQLNAVDLVTATVGFAVGNTGKILAGVGYAGVSMGDPLNPNPSKPNATVVLQQVTQVSFAIDTVGALNISSVTPTCVPVPNIDFNIVGAKLIGTSPNILKYNTNQQTDGSGLLELDDFEWDSYVLTPTDSAYNLSGSVPIAAFALAPGATQNLQLVMSPRSDKALMISVKDFGTKLPISNASVRLTGPSSYDKTLTTGRGFLRQTDWSGASGQTLFSDPLRYFSDDTHTDGATPTGELKLKPFGGIYPASGNLTSSTFDTGSVSNFYNLTFIPAQPPLAGPNSVRFQLATNNDQATWDFKGPDGTQWSYYTATNTNISAVNNGNRYVRYKAYLSTIAATTTPDLSEVAFTFTSSCVPPGQVLFDGLASGTYTLNATATGYTSHADTVSMTSNWQQLDSLMSP